MRRDTLTVDGFYADPHAIVRFARSLPYLCPYSRLGYDANGAHVAWRTSKYRSSSECPFKSSNELRRSLEFLTGEKIDLDYWNIDFPLDAAGYPAPGYETMPRGSWWNCSFHVKHCPQLPGEGVHNHTEADLWNTAGEDGWVGIVYLNEGADLQTGLQTWDSKDPARRYEWMTPASNWRLVDTFAGVFNRLVLHRGCVPHSGAPGWGSSVLDGRLFQTFFFKTVRVRQRRALSMNIRS